MLWGIAAEAGPWPCPLTLAEQFLETRAGLAAYQGSFLLHLLDAIVYPNVPDWLVTVLGAGVCAFNLGIYLWRLRIFTARQPASELIPVSAPCPLFSDLCISSHRTFTLSL